MAAVTLPVRHFIGDMVLLSELHPDNPDTPFGLYDLAIGFCKLANVVLEEPEALIPSFPV
ncbi:hypothetical protein C2U70_20620 [Bradyrhizobium guangdongense]|uniref:DUF2958 domain-containing protein n=1 Tax=Bradyrhizobium guangdongense TaxID=1325090 RepID=UPI001126F76F|nr:DUF2958 domain-containing protein [Bradyrhizobium guangdongense]TPQ32854.1 hypothetical protein C2U70_20620 [Bradyrhizobium guangdongense]